MSTPETARWRVLRVLPYAFAQAVVLLVLVEPLRGLGWLSGFRNYYSSDQLSYAAIASNVSIGDLRAVEPLSQTGMSFYPSAWYFLVGLVAHLTPLTVPMAWTALGLAAVGGAVGLLGWVAARMSGLLLAPVLPALALLTGTWSTWMSGSWLTHMSTHAALWGPYGTLFTLNGEAVGLMLGACALALILLCAAGGLRSDRGSRAALLVAAAVIGGLANVHIYSFFTTLSLAAAFVAVWSLLTYPSRVRTVLTIALVVAMLVLGMRIAALVGPLPTLALMLAALLPAAWPLVRAHVRMAALLGAVLVVTAGYQVARTLWGFASGDEFLSFRQTDSSNLSVAWDKALIAIVPVALVALAAAWLLRGRRDTACVSLLVALPIGGVVMASNDLWGFDQEPYRFWVEYLLVGSLLVSIVLARALASLRRREGTARTRDAVVLGVAVVVWATSLVDLVGFRSFAHETGVIDPGSPRLQAAARLLQDRPGLVLSSDCLDPQVLKLATRAPVVFYNQGLAWPAVKDDFLIFQDRGRRAAEDSVALRAAGVDYVLTDSACATDWSYPPGWAVLPVATEAYVEHGSQALTLHRVAR